MSEIEVGEYVRTEEGYIGILIEYIPNALNYLKIDVGKEIRRDNGMSDNYIYTRYGFQLKHSKQLIDLIEVGDFVNGYRVLAIESSIYENSKRILIYRNEREKYERWIYIQEYNGRIKTQDDIVVILTKEQFEANCYKVGGEDE